jgi:hypothetical protein
MADIQSFLTKKAGPLPVWGWAAAGGGLISVLWLARRGQQPAAAATGQAATPNVPYVPSPIIVTPGNMPSSTSSANPGNPPPTAQPGNATTRQPGGGGNWDRSMGGIVVRPAPNSNAPPVGFIPFNSRFTIGSPTGGGSASLFWWDPGQTVNSNTWYPVTAGGPQGFVSGLDVVSGMGGGAASSVMNFVPGSGGGKILRHSGPHAHPQYVGMGGGGTGGGHSALRTVSQRTRVPMTRLMSLNPGHWHPRQQRPTTIHIA